MLSRRPLTDLEVFGEGEVGFQVWSLVSRRTEWRFGYADEDGEWQGAWSSGGAMPLAVGVWGGEDGPPLMVQALGAPRPDVSDEEEEAGDGEGMEDGRGPGGEGDDRRRRRNGNGDDGRDPGSRDPGDRGGDDRDSPGGRR